MWGFWDWHQSNIYLQCNFHVGQTLQPQRIVLLKQSTQILGRFHCKHQIWLHPIKPQKRYCYWGIQVCLIVVCYPALLNSTCLVSTKKSLDNSENIFRLLKCKKQKAAAELYGFWASLNKTSWIKVAWEDIRFRLFPCIFRL